MIINIQNFDVVDVHAGSNAAAFLRRVTDSCGASRRGFRRDFAA
jgi:hypothetical protein